MPLVRPAFTILPEHLAYVDARARRIGLNRSAYVRAGLAMAYAATDEQVLIAVNSLPISRSEAPGCKEAGVPG